MGIIYWKKCFISLVKILNTIMNSVKKLFRSLIGHFVLELMKTNNDKNNLFFDITITFYKS